MNANAKQVTPADTFARSTKNPYPIAAAAIAFCLGMVIASNVGCASHQPEANLFQSNTMKDISFTTENPKAPPIRDLAAGEELSEALRMADGPVIVDFYADWCGPCKKQTAELHSLEDQIASSQTTVIKVNADRFPELKNKYDVAGLPTLLLVRDGIVTDRSVGLTRGQKLQNWIR